MQLDGANRYGWNYRLHRPQLVTFELDGRARLSIVAPQAEKPLVDASFKVDAKLAAEGAFVYFNCMACHGAEAVSLGSAPDLRASAIPLSEKAFEDIVKRGTLAARGMPAYGDLDARQLAALRNYIRHEANLAIR